MTYYSAFLEWAERAEWRDVSVYPYPGAGRETDPDQKVQRTCSGS